MTIWLNKPAVRDALWREHLRCDADKLGAELRTSRRNFLRAMGTTALVAAVDEYLMMRRTHAMFLHGGGAIPTGGVSAITNQRTGQTYQYLPQAIYTGAQTGDTILIPAGLVAPGFPSTPYADYRQLDSHYWGFAGTPNGYGNMYIGPGWSNYTGSPPWTNASQADYVSLVGVGSANNGRAVFSRPYGTLVADWNPGDTVLYLTNVETFNPNGGQVNAWGDGNITWGGTPGLSYSAADVPNGRLTGVSGTTPMIPAGTIAIMPPPNSQGLIGCYSPNPGCTFTNLEMWGANEGGGNATCVSILMGAATPTQTQLGSVTLNNCYIHDCNHGIGRGEFAIGNSIFAHLFGTEIYRCGLNDRTHNTYFGTASEIIFDGSYSHHTQGTHLFKSRASTHYITYSRISGERSDLNPGGIESCNMDICHGGLAYIIGNAFEQSLNAANCLCNWNAENFVNSNGAANHPDQELYFINNTCIGPANGTGYGGGTDNTGIAPIQTWNLGVQNPESPFLAKVSGGSLAARTYVIENSCTTAASQESSTSYPISANASVPILNALAVPANDLIEVASPVARTGANGWNTYANYLDPILYNSTGGLPQVGNYWFWDALYTQPVFSEAPGGSNPTTFLYCAFTYQFPTGESALLGVWGMTGGGLTIQNFETMAGYWTADLQPSTLTSGQTFWNAALFQVDANNLMSVTSPPSVPGATAWNFYCTPTTWNSSGNYTQIGNSFVTGLTKQNASPIALGTAWTEPTTGFIRAEQTTPNMMRQNASTLTLGTAWTEPTSGLVNNNPTKKLLKWLRRAGWPGNSAYMDEWFAIAPTSLTNYTATIYFNGLCDAAAASVIAISGAQAPYPFTANQTAPALSLSSPGSVTFGESDVMVVGLFWGQTGAGSGFTPIYTGPGIFMSEYKMVSSPGTVSVTQATGSSPSVCDVLVPSAGETLSVNGSPVTLQLLGPSHGGTWPGTVMQITFSASAGDVILLQVTSLNGQNIAAIDQVAAPPQFGVFGSIAVDGAPIGLVQNTLAGNYQAAVTGGFVTTYNPKTFPAGFLTMGGNNISINSFNGSAFDAPLFSAIFADPTPTDYDYRLKLGSSPIGAGTNPGNDPVRGRHLQPAYELKLFGLPMPGTPIPAKTARTDSGSITPDVGAYQFRV